MYKFQEIFCEYKNIYQINENSFKLTYNNYTYCFNYDFYSLYIKKIFYFLDGNWEENLTNYIMQHEPKFSFIFPIIITEEDLFYFKLKLPNDVFDTLFSETNYIEGV